MSGSEDEKPAIPQKAVATSREERLAARLRDNLKRRKEQARQRSQDGGADTE